MTSEEYDALPDNVRDILDQATGDEDYSDCANLVCQLEAIGWTAEYGLDAALFDVRPKVT